MGGNSNPLHRFNWQAGFLRSGMSTRHLLESCLLKIFVEDGRQPMTSGNRRVIVHRSAAWERKSDDQLIRV
jgi:hypothetical protein